MDALRIVIHYKAVLMVIMKWAHKMFVSSSMKWFKIYSELKFRHDPPLLYNVEADPQELYKLTRDTFADYDEVTFATLF